MIPDCFEICLKWYTFVFKTNPFSLKMFEYFKSFWLWQFKTPRFVRCPFVRCPWGELWGEQRWTRQELECPKFRDPTRQRTARPWGSTWEKYTGIWQLKTWYLGIGIYVYRRVIFTYIYIYFFLVNFIDIHI